MENVKTKNNLLVQVAKCVLCAIIINMAYVLLFAGILKIFNLDNSVIKLINQIAKVVILLVVGIICIKGEKKILKGILFGCATLGLSYFIFMLLSGTSFSIIDFAIELGFGVLVGAIVGIIVKILK